MKRLGIFLLLASLLLGLAVSVRPVSAGTDDEEETVVSTERSGGSSEEKAEKPEKGASYYVKRYIIAAVIGLIIALIVTGSMQAGMKNVTYTGIFRQAFLMNETGSSHHPAYPAQRKIAHNFIPYISTLTGWPIQEKPIL